MFDNFSKVYVSVEYLAVRIMHVDPDRLLFMFDERILIFLKTESFYLPSVKTPKMAANPLKKTEIRRYTTEVPAFRPFFQRYGWTLWPYYKLNKGLFPGNLFKPLGGLRPTRGLNKKASEKYPLFITYILTICTSLSSF